MAVPVVVNPATVGFAVQAGSTGVAAAVEVAGISAAAAAGLGALAIGGGVIVVGGLVWLVCSD